MEKQAPMWSSGYVTDLEYTHGFYREIEPGYLCYAALISGHLPPNIDSDFTYCELGCGNGLSTNIIASVWPQGTFIGVDFNPSHILNGSLLAKAAGLNNLRFLEADFRDLDTYDLPEFDFITVHGVLSWINDENRKAIQRFVLKKLKPGGILYLSYNCLPGWTAVMPVRELMKRFADDTHGNITDRMNSAINSVDKAFAVQSGFFNGNGFAETRFNQIKTANRHYLAHEYFNRDWQPFYSADINSEFSNAKVSFIGSAELFDPYLHLYASQNAMQMINGARNVTMKETLKDYFLNRMFRKDLFMRGVNRMTLQEHSAILDEQRFFLSVPRNNVVLTMKFPFGEAKGKEQIYNPIVDALAEKSLALRELYALPFLCNENPANIVQAVTMLMASGQLGLATQKEMNEKTADKMNQAILKRSFYSNEIGFMSSPVLKTGIPVPWFRQLLIRAVQENHKADDFVWGILDSLGQRMQFDGKPISEPEKNKEEIRLRYDEFLKTDLPFLKKVGIVN